MIILEKAMNSQYKYLLKGMWKWDKSFFKDFFPALLKNKTTIMRKLSLNEKKNTQKVCERNSYFLAKESFAPLPMKIEKRCMSLVWEVTDNDYICIDEVDIAKPTAKLMEWIAKVRDWSTWNIVNWFIFHWVSIKNIPVIIQQEDLTNKFKAEYFSIIIDRMIKYTKGKWIYVLDALYDIASYLDFLNNKWVKYIIRAKKNRWYFDVKSNKKLKLKEFTDWTYEVKIVNVEKTVFLHIKTNPKYPEPIRILSNSKNTDTEEYKKRWEIETIFKTMKQEFEMEKIQAWSLQVLNNIVAIIQLAVALSSSIYKVTSDFKWTTFFWCWKIFTTRFKKYTRHEALTMNKNSIIWFISSVIQGMYKNWYSTKKKWINTNLWIRAQLKLFTVVDLKKTR